MKKVSAWARNYWSYLLVGAFLLVALAYVAVNGENIYIPIWDNLNDFVVRFQILRENGLFWKIDANTPMLGGLNRNYFTSDLEAYSWLYMLLPTFWAYVTGWFLKIVMAVSGAAVLGKTLLEENFPKYRHVIVLCGLIYGLCPQYPTLAFGFASLPFLMALLIHFYRNPKPYHYVLLFFYPLFSSFVYFGIFICGYMTLFFLIDWAVTKKPKWRFLAGLALVAFGYVILDWRLFYIMFVSGEITTRSGIFVSSTFTSPIKVLTSFLWLFVVSPASGGYAAQQMYLMLPVCLIYFLYWNIRMLRSGDGWKAWWKQFWREPFHWLMFWLVFNCLIHGLKNYRPFKTLITTLAPALTNFDLSRTCWFNGFIWCFAFALILGRLHRRSWAYLLCALGICVECFSPVVHNHVYGNLYFQAFKGREDRQIMSYGEYYSPDLFQEVKEAVGYNGEWSAAYFMEPAVLEYNGIATLDGYRAIYSLRYYQQFKKLIAPELEVDEKMKNFFERHSLFAYLPSTEPTWALPSFPSMPSDPSEDGTYYEPVTETELLIDMDVFREMGGKYIFSRVNITNADALGLEKQGVFSGHGSPYTVHVYRTE